MADTTKNVFIDSGEVRMDVEHFWWKWLLSLCALGAATLLVLYSTAANDISTSLFLFFNQHIPSRIGSGLLVFTEIGSFWGVALIVVMLLALRRTRPAITIAATGFLSVISANSIKLFTTFKRPYVILDETVLRVTTAVGITNNQLAISGFPSGHTAAITIVAAGLWPYVTRPMRFMLVFLIAAVGLGRLYAGVHFPLDILGGLALGLALALPVRQLIARYGSGPRTTNV